MKRLFLLWPIMAALACSPGQRKDIYGRWSLTFKDGSDVTVVFRKDSTHDYFINGKLFSSGRSIIRNDTLRTMDPICNADYFATYRVEFLSPDSIQLVTVEDTCPPRKRDMDGVKLQRVK